jgi:hypothetical protein
MDSHLTETFIPNAQSARPLNSSNAKASSLELTAHLAAARIPTDKARRTHQYIYLGYSAKRVAEIAGVPVWYCELVKLSCASTREIGI